MGWQREPFSTNSVLVIREKKSLGFTKRNESEHKLKTEDSLLELERTQPGEVFVNTNMPGL